MSVVVLICSSLLEDAAKIIAFGRKIINSQSSFSFFDKFFLYIIFESSNIR
jgi:hypothetical protein